MEPKFLKNAYSLRLIYLFLQKKKFSSIQIAFFSHKSVIFFLLYDLTIGSQSPWNRINIILKDIFVVDFSITTLRNKLLTHMWKQVAWVDLSDLPTWCRYQKVSHLFLEFVFLSFLSRCRLWFFFSFNHMFECNSCSIRMNVIMTALFVYNENLWNDKQKTAFDAIY